MVQIPLPRDARRVHEIDADGRVLAEWVVDGLQAPHWAVSRDALAEDQPELPDDPEAVLWQQQAASGECDPDPDWCPRPGAPFQNVAPWLYGQGYRCVPIKPGEKRPLTAGWQKPRHPRHYLPYRDEDTGRVTACRHWGTGVLTATAPGIDLDIKDRETVRALIGLADETLGVAPFRIGQPPKALLAYRTKEPFDKLMSRWWALPGENWRAAKYAPHRIEILCDGQQYVSVARHPRGTLYRWRRGSPLTIPRADLPSLTEASAKAFLRAAEALLEELGAIPVSQSGGTWSPVLTRPEPAPRPIAGRSVGDAPPGRGWQRLEPEDLARRIDPKHARRTRHGWITSCPAHTSEGHRSLSLLPREGGGSIAHCFAECSFQDIASAIYRIVGDI